MYYEFHFLKQTNKSCFIKLKKYIILYQIELTVAATNTLLNYFYKWEIAKANEVFLRQPNANNWQQFTWAEIGVMARKMASFLKQQKFPPKSHIGIISKNCYHWVVADLAIMMSGHISVPFYANTAKEELAYVTEHSNIKLLFVGKLDEWEERQKVISKNLKTVAFPHYKGNAIIEANYYWDTLCKTNEPLKENYQPQLNDLFTIIYTSGTTGKPKGVMHTWASVSSLVHSQEIYDDLKTANINVRLFSYLPLNHIAERIFIETLGIFRGGTISFAESLDTFAENLSSVQPTHFIAVPRIWTRFKLAIVEKMGEKKLSRMMKTPIVKSIIKKTIKKKLGLSKAVLVLTGAAPMAAKTINWYKQFDIYIQEVYGMTENNGGCTLMPADNIKLGTVGKAIAEVELKIEEQTGELLMKAPWLMTGYYANIEKTNETLKDGWLHTGDIGSIDAAGYLTLTGRLNDNFKTTKGKFITPVPLEYAFSVNSNVEQVCVTGSILPQPVALCVLSEIGKAKPKTEVEESLLSNLIDTNMGQPNYTKIKKVIIVNDNWSLENGQLTATLKIKRNVVFQQYKNKLENWYEDEAQVVWA